MMGMSIRNQRYSYSYSYSITLILYLITQITKPVSSFSLKDPNFNSSDFTLIGDAQISDHNVVNLTGGPTTPAQIIYNNPFQLEPITSFSTDFTFSLITPGNNEEQQQEDRFAFLVFPSGGPLSHQGYFGDSHKTDPTSGFVAVEYRIIHNDVGVHVVDATSFASKHDVMSNNVSLIGFGLKSWVDYEASSKRLEIRVGESGSSSKPVEPLVSFAVDLAAMWEGKKIVVGVSSGGRGGITSLSSWSFGVRTVPSSLHSQPLDPVDHDQRGPVGRSKSRFLTVLGALIFGTGCGTLVAFVALFLWVVLFSRHSSGGVTEMPMSQVDFKYEKVNVIVDSESHTTS